jgi:hypothetical protein
MSTATLIQATKKERPGTLQDILLLELTGRRKNNDLSSSEAVDTNFLLLSLFHVSIVWSMLIFTFTLQ